MIQKLKDKYVFIIEYSKHFNIPLSKMAFVDDRLDVLRKAEESGITAYHPSSFTE